MATIVEEITTFVDDYLVKASAARKVEKSSLCIYMYLLANESKNTLTNALFEDNKTFINFVTIKQVVTGLVGTLFSSKIERSIVNGFNTYAEETKFNVLQLKLRLYYRDGDKLVYQAYYQDKPIAVDIENFFSKK